jgi:hypothetical protein
VFKIRTIVKAAVVPLIVAAPAGAQAQTVALPAADEPSIRFGAQLFVDDTVLQQPKIKDADGNTVTLSRFHAQVNF